MSLDVDNVYLGDCLEKMQLIDDKSIDCIICDLPYQVTAAHWDSLIDFKLLWTEYKRIIKDKRAIVLTGTQTFTTSLISSNLEWFKYELIWEKSKASNFLQVKNQPLKAHENILIFSNGTPLYNPQKTAGKPYLGEKRAGKKGSETEVYNTVPNPLFRRGSADGSRYPRSVQYFKTAESEGKQSHPTQKPIALCEYLIRTYSNEGDIILDNCAGSGSTLVAAKNLNRRYIGIEKEKNYYDIIKERLK